MKPISEAQFQPRIGRPSKRIPKVVKAICSGISDGLPLKYAAALGGISHETLCQWQRRYPDFSEAIQKAMANGIAARLKIIAGAAQTDYRAAQWWLEHVFPEHFARNRVEVKHEGSVEHQFAIPSALLDQLAQARAQNERPSNV